MAWKVLTRMNGILNQSAMVDDDTMGSKEDHRPSPFSCHNQIIVPVKPLVSSLLFQYRQFLCSLSKLFFFLLVNL